MKEVIKKNFYCVNDFERVHEFLSKIYDCGAYHNWDTGRWSFNRYCTHNEEELSNNRTWENSVALWEDSNGEIVAVAHIEEPGDYFLQVHPDYKYLEENMLLWAIENCHKCYPNLDKISLQSCYSDKERKELYLKYQASIQDGIDEKRTVELRNGYSIPQLPDGYKVTNIDGADMEVCRRVSELYTCVWPTSTYMPNGETAVSMTKSPAFKKDLSFVIVNDKEQYVAFTIAWVDSINKVAHFYPVAVVAEYLDSNILEVMLKRALNKLIECGYNKATIAAWYCEEEEQIFKSLGFEKTDYEEFYHIKI